MLRSTKRPAPSVSARKVCAVLLWSNIFAAAIGTPFSSTMTPAQSAESVADIFAAVIPHKKANSTAIRATERMLYRGTAGDGCAAFLGSFATAILARDQEDFLRLAFRALFDFGFRAGFGGSKIHAGGSLAGKESLEASSTGSRLCETSSAFRGSRSSDFGDEDSRFSTGLAIAILFYFDSLPCVTRRNARYLSVKVLVLRLDGRLVGTRTPDLHRVKVAL